MKRVLSLLVMLSMLMFSAADAEGLPAAQAGDYVVLGAFEQDGDTSNGAEPIEWLVVACEGERMLLVSRYGLDARRYNDGQAASVTWKTCTLRQWLGGEFLKTAFQPWEQALILPTHVTADDNTVTGVLAGSATEDRIFLLSTVEAETYFPDEASRACYATPYAISRGAHNDAQGCWQWLRSPGSSLGRAASLGVTGGINYNGSNVRGQEMSVRPAMWVKVGPGEAAIQAGKAWIASAGYISFGAYEQDGDASNGAEPIDWIILDQDGDRLLVISRYALDAQRYNNGQSNVVTWRTCTLRKWLGGEFLNTAFLPWEQALIQPAVVPAHDNTVHGVQAGYDTEDRIFLLSTVETEFYFPSATARSCIATPYAISRGAFADEYGCFQWLRNPGSSLGRAAGVSTAGEVDYHGGGVRSQQVAVRPAMWVTIAPGVEIVRPDDASRPAATPAANLGSAGGSNSVASSNANSDARAVPAFTRIDLTAAGFMSDVAITLFVDRSGVITALRVDASGETPGFGTRCSEDTAFLEQFLGKSLPLAAEVDALSGATVTSNAIIAALREIAR